MHFKFSLFVSTILDLIAFAFFIFLESLSLIFSCLASARWIGNHGFSIGIDDVTPGETLVKQKQGEIDRNYKKCEDCIQQFNEGKLAVQPGCDAAQTLEAEVTMSLNKVRDDIGKVRTMYLVMCYLFPLKVFSCRAFILSKTGILLVNSFVLVEPSGLRSLPSSRDR